MAQAGYGRKRLSRYFKRVPFLGEIFRYYPDSWVYYRVVLKWMFEPPLGKQLPPLYQIFRIYSYLYFKLTGEPRLIGGRELFGFLANLFNQFSTQDYLKFSLTEYEAFLDPTDARFFQVVGELSSDDSDVRVLYDLLSQGDSFIDVGANHGSFSIVASKIVGANGFVSAIEPQPRLAEIVEKSLALNALCNFQVHQVAVGDTDGEIELLVPQGTSGSAGIYPKHSGTHKHDILKVPVKRFDDFIDWQSFPGKALIKLDIEGSEIKFLAGAREMITSLKPNLIIEVNPRSLKAAGKTGRELKNFLQSLGYKKYSGMSNLKEVFPIEDLDTQTQKNIVALMS